MILPHRIRSIVFSVETENVFSPEKLWITYKLTLQNSKPPSSVYIFIKYTPSVQISLQKC